MRISTFLTFASRKMWPPKLLARNASEEVLSHSARFCTTSGVQTKAPPLWRLHARSWTVPLSILLTIVGLLPHVSQAQYIQTSTYLGGNSVDSPTGMQVVNGETYVIGQSTSSNYPVTNGSTQTSLSPDIVVTKLDAAGNIIYSTYLGGNQADEVYYSKVVNGELYLFGRTQSNNYPVTNGSTFGGAGNDAVLTKLDATGNIVFSTYLGGNGPDFPNAIEVVNGEIHLLARTSSSNFPSTNGSTFGGGSSDLAYTKLSASTGNILFSTYIGGNANESGANKIVVVGGKVYIVGVTSSTNFPVTNGSTLRGISDIVIVRLDAAGTIEFASYYGGTGGYTSGPFAVENGEVYVAASTTSTNFPVTDGSTSSGGLNDMVYFKVNAAGNVVFSTYLGGNSSEGVQDLQVINGEGYILGFTESANFPVTNGSVFSGGDYDITYTRFNTAGQRVVSTYLGGNADDLAYEFAVVNGEVNLTGITRQTNSTYPVTNGSYPRTNFENGIYTKLDAATGKILYSTIFGGIGATNPQFIRVENGLAYILTSAGLGYPVTNGVGYKAGTEMALTIFKLCGTFPATPANVAPASQTVCQNGFTQTLTAPQIAISSSDMPTLYRNGVPEQQPLIEAFYQWQQATSATGPWTDIAGATQKDYVPGSVSSTRYYRRVSTNGPCCGNTVVNTSSVASIIISSSAAPTVNAGDVLNKCVGSPITLGGSPTASGGTGPYTYAWDNGAAAVANPSVNPLVTTIYTLTVTDANGCQQIDQALVNVYAAYAGADAGFCAGTPVQIGGAPIPGVPGVTYSWAPATGLSCTDCAQPFANPSSQTTYTLTMTLPISGGGTCTSTDAVVVTPVAAPVTPNFAGPDVTICIGNTATIGTPAESGFTYTWAPGNYLVTNNSAQVTFQPGSLAMPTPNPITYYVTALKDGCTFVDQMQASVIEARAGVDGCGPRTIGEPDRTPNIGETYTWTKLSGPGNFSGATNLPVVPVTASVGGATTYRLTVSYNGTTCTDDVVVPDCGCVVDIKVQAPFVCPSFGLNNGNVKLIASAADIYSSDPNVFTYTWSPAAGLSSTTGREVTLTDNVQRTYTVTMSSPFDPSFACTRTITVNNPAWSLPVFTAQNVATCPAVPVQIGAPPVAGYAYEWVGSVLSSTAVSNPTATVNGTTQFSVKVTDVGSGCITRDTVQVSLASVAADAGPNQTVCPNGVVTIGTPAEPNTTYSWSPAGANWQNGTNQNSAQPQVLVAVTTVFSVTATNSQAGCTSVDQVTVTAGTPIPAFTLPDITYCPGNGPVTLGGTAPTGTGYTYSWEPSGLVTNPRNNATTTRTPPPSTPTTFTLTVRNAEGCEQVATQTITPTNTPPSAGSNQNICLGSTVSLGSASNPTGSGISYNWTPSTGLSSATSPNPTFTPTAAGIYSFTLVKTEGACTSPATVTVTVNSFSLAAMPSVAVCQGACVTIGTTAVPNVQYSWSPATGLSNPNSATTVACVNASTTYTLTGVDLNGCVASQQVLVGVNNSPAPTVNIPSVTACLGSGSATFSPVVSPAGSYNYVWSPNNGTLSNIYAANPAVAVTSVGTRIYSLTVTNTATGCSSSQPAQIDVILCCVKPDAGQDISVCPPAPTAQLAPVTSGGTWTAQTGNPAPATVNASGAVSGMTVNGIYRFIYSVSTNGTICTDTVAVSRQQPLSMVVTPGVCLSATNQYAISGTVSLTNVAAGTLAITDGTQSTTLAVNGGSSTVPFSLTGLTSGSGSHTVTATYSGCGSTSATYTAPVSCSANPCVKPNAGTDVRICSNVSTTTLTTAPANQTWTAQTGNPANAVIAQNGQVTGMTVNGTYRFILSASADCSDTVQIIRSPLSLTLAPRTCDPATNKYLLSGNVTIPTAQSAVLTVVDGTYSTTVTVPANSTSVSFTVQAQESGTGSHTVIAALSSCGSTTTTYAAPDNCGTCSLSVTPTVSGCYSVSGVSKTTVSVEVAWTSAPSNGTIAVQYGSQIKYITPGTVNVSYTNPTLNTTQLIVSPQVVAFEVDANSAANQVITAQFSNNTACQATSTSFSLPAPCPPTSCTDGNLGGTVFNDFDADGVKDTGETTGIGSISVTAYACDGTVYTTTTDVFGLYTLSIPADKYPVRVEFTNLPTYAGNGTTAGTNGKTTVQFVSTANCDVSVGVLSPNDYCQDNPKIIVPCYLNGDPNNASHTGEPAIVSFGYSLTGTKTALATIPQVGPVWGTAYNKFNNTLYSAAFLRRHVGLTSHGLGAIFKTDLATNSTTLFVDVENIGVSLGSIGSNASRGLGAKTSPSADAEAFAKVGKVGIGDIDISEDGQTLYFVNMFTKSLHRLAVNNPTSSQSVAIPSPACANGESRPWGMAIYKGNAYIGVVCDASVSANKSDLRAYIYSYSLSTNTFDTTPVFDFPLTYPKGYPHDSKPSLTGWFPWTDDPNVAFNSIATTIPTTHGNILVHPEPILADIEFDIDGSMVLSFADRFAFQVGHQNYNTSGTGLYSGVSGGDILRAFYRGNTFVLENNAKAGPLTGYGPNNVQGPGFGEFYNDDFFYTGTNNIRRRPHSENALGGLALKPGSGEVIYSAMDPVDQEPESGGVRKVSNQTGLTTGSLFLYQGILTEGGFFAKAAGIGDPSITCGLPTYLQIGNRVWRDDNSDGIQDPCELPIPGVVVSLYDATKTTLIASATTNAAGEYYFSDTSINAASTTWSVSTTALTANTRYALVITNLGSSTVANGLSLTGVSPVTPGESGTINSGTTPINNDARVVSGRPCIEMTTGAVGTVNHTFDFGLICVPPSVTALAASNSVCLGQPATIYAQVSPAGNYSYTITGPAGVTLSNANSGTAVATGLTVGVNTFTVTVGSNPVCQTTSFVSVSLVAPPSITLTSGTVCAGQPISLTASGAGQGATYVFSTTGAVGNVLTVRPALTTVYTVTATTSGGCSSVTSATVTVNSKPNAGSDQALLCGPLGSTPTSTTLSATPVGGTWSNMTGNPTTAIFTPNANATTASNLMAGTYGFVYTASNGCTDTLQVNVPLCQTFCASLSATASANSSTVTIGSSATLTANVTPAGSYTYTWSGPSGVTITPTNAASAVVSNLATGVNTFTVTIASSPGCFTTATVSVTALAPVLAITATPGACVPATNQYSVSGTLSLTNAVAGTATITDGTSTTTVSVTAGQTSVPYTLVGLNSGTGSHTVTVSYVGQTASTTYTAPVSCTVAPPCLLQVVVTPGLCQSATNQYTVTGSVSATNAVGSQVVTITDGVASTTVTLTGNGPSSFTLTGLSSDGSLHTVSASASSCGVASTTYTAPASCSVDVAITVTPGVCQSATNQYTITGTLSLTNAPAGTVTITDGAVSTTVAVSAGATSVPYSLTGLTSGTGSHTVTVNFAGKTATITYTAPVSCEGCPPAKCLPIVIKRTR